MELEHFPTSEAGQRMLERVSPIYEEAYVAKWLFEVMGLEWDEARLIFEELKLQAFPETATWGLRYWEERYRIPVDESRPPEERRREVLLRRSFRAPMNPERIEDVVGRMTGRVVHVEENAAPYVFTVHLLDGGNILDYPAVRATLRRMKPSHQNFMIDVVMTARVRERCGSMLLRGLTLAFACRNRTGGMEAAQPIEITVRGARPRYGLRVYLTTDTMWRLDGSVLLDGSRKLNAGIIEEEI